MLLARVQGILEHTLFKGTYFPTWEGLFWEKVCDVLLSLSLLTMSTGECQTAVGHYKWHPCGYAS
jgi:hypothetical protein